MNNLEIKKAPVTNVLELQLIGRQTFSETFSEHNSVHDMQMYLEINLSIEKLTEELNDPNSEFYFALLNNKVIGYLKMNYGQSQTESIDESSLEIERIYVLKDFQSKNVGQVLFNKAIDIAGQRNAKYVWLGVWENNPRAINFYKKNGFEEFDKHIFKLGNDEQTDIMMRLKF